MKGQRSLLLKGAAWVSAGNLLVNLLGFLSLIILTRLLMPEDFGLVAIAASFAEIIGVITELSLAAAIIQLRTVEQVHFDTAFTMNVIRGLMVAGLIAASGPFIAQFYGDPRLTGLLQFLALASLITSLSNPKLVVFKRKLDFRQAALMSIANKLTAFLFAAGVAIIYQSYWALVVGVVAAGVVTLVLSYTFIPYRPRFSLGAWRDLLSFSIWVTVGRWIQTVNWRSTTLVLGYFLPVALLGQQRIANRLLGATVQQTTAPIKALLFPAFSRLQEDEQRLRRGYIRSQSAICLITYPIAAGVALLAEELVLLLVGEKWLLSVPLIKIVAVIHMIRTVQNVNALAMATANTKAMAIRDLCLFFIRWPLILGGLYIGRADPYSMLLYAMGGQVLSVACGMVLNITLIKRISTISVSDHVGLVWRPLASACVMAGVVLLADATIPQLAGFFGLAARAALLAALGAATYFAVLFAIWNAMGREQTVEWELTTIGRDLALKSIAKVRAAWRAAHT
ncbi:MAG: lipopolysaccharide biosynthesis protein [Pseudomonadota bacterium]